MKVLKWILTGILVALLIAAGIAYFQGYRIATVVSGSMEPTITTGSIVVMDSNETDPEVGDIICYQREDKVIMHRLISIENGAYTTQGDANAFQDPAFTKDRIQGTVIYDIPNIGYVVMFVQKHVVAIIVGIIALTAIGSLLMRIGGKEDAETE